MKQQTKIIISIASIILVAVLGSIFVAIGMPWFKSLIKPSQFVPSFVIPIVWTIIYVSLGVILFNWLKTENLPKSVTTLLIINGILNVLWCLVFFALKQTQLGNIIILINLYFGAYLIYAISKYKKLYSIILTLYPIWLLIASSLNTALWILN